MPAQSREILWTPGTNARQADFLAADEDEVLYGGAAGGGKSDAILIDALGLQQNAIEYKQYQAVLFRRTFKELSDLIDRSKELYNQNVEARFRRWVDEDLVKRHHVTMQLEQLDELLAENRT